jgi:hypothetical protein
MMMQVTWNRCLTVIPRTRQAECAEKLQRVIDLLTPAVSLKPWVGAVSAHAVGLMLLSLALSGCIPVPRFVEEPFQEDVPGLIAGLTTKDDVLQLFGEPGATYEQESVFVYAKFQETITFIGPDMTFGNQHFLVLSFDQNGVLGEFSIDTDAPDFRGCSASGWCSAYGARVLRLADSGQDAIAKRFLSPGDRCGIYIYGPISPLVAVSIDGQSIGGVFSKRYFQFWKVDPGTHEVALVLQPGEEERWGLKNLPSVSATCAEGELVFIRLKKGWTRAFLKVVEPSEGRKQIEERRLIVSGPMRRISAQNGHVPSDQQ